MITQDNHTIANSVLVDAHEHLSILVGGWHAAGRSFAQGQRADSPRASSQPWTSNETYEWLPGERFLLHRWDAMVGDYPFQGIEIIGHDPVKHSYFSRLFDNAGNYGEYAVERSGSIWRFNGAETRAVISFTSDGREMDIAWQWKNRGHEWLPLCERRARRSKDQCTTLGQPGRQQNE